MKGHKCSAPYGSGIVMNEGDDSFPKNSSDNVILSDGGGFVVYEGCAPTGGGCFRKGNTDVQGVPPPTALGVRSGVDGKSCKTLSLKQFQAKGYEKGTTTGTVPPTPKIVDMARALLTPNYPSNTEYSSSSSSSYWDRLQGLAAAAVDNTEDATTAGSPSTPSSSSSSDVAHHVAVSGGVYGDEGRVLAACTASLSAPECATWIKV